MIDNGGAEDAKDDGERFFEACREDERQQLGLVTN